MFEHTSTSLVDDEKWKETMFVCVWLTRFSKELCRKLSEALTFLLYPWYESVSSCRSLWVVLTVIRVFTNLTWMTININFLDDGTYHFRHFLKSKLHKQLPCYPLICKLLSLGKNLRNSLYSCWQICYLFLKLIEAGVQYFPKKRF